jgi:hypothetical protein
VNFRIRCEEIFVLDNEKKQRFFIETGVAVFIVL